MVALRDRPTARAGVGQRYVPSFQRSGDGVSKKKIMMVLATTMAVVLGGAATALAASPSAKGSAKTNKDFAGLVDIGGGRKM
jgi:hypothetical protein